MLPSLLLILTGLSGLLAISAVLYLIDQPEHAARDFAAAWAIVSTLISLGFAAGLFLSLP